MTETMDPRIEARRAEVRRQAAKKWRWAAASVAVVVTVSVAAFAFSRSSLVGVHRVVLRGASPALLAQVRSAGGLRNGLPLADMSVASAASGIEKLPWVLSATVRRSWPRTVVVSVVVRKPVAVVAEAGHRYAAVDRTGRVLSAPVASRPPLPLLTGQLAPGAVGTWLNRSGTAAASVAGALPPSLAARVVYIFSRFVPNGTSAVPGGAGGSTGGSPEVVLRLSAGPLVEMGSATALQAKVVALATLLQDVSLSGVKVVDLKVPEAPTLTAG